MNFHEHTLTLWHQEKRRPTTSAKKFQEYYGFLCQQLSQNKFDGSNKIEMLASTAAYHVLLELSWWLELRPYYKVWPSIIKALTKISMDVEVSKIELKEFPLLIRLPLGCESHGIQYVLTRFDKKANALIIQLNHEDGKSLDMLPPFRFTEGRTLQWFIENTCLKGLQMQDGRESSVVLDRVKTALQIALTICLLADDPSIITPDVLSKDRKRYEAETDEAWKERAVARARHRGVVGWNIGAEYEVCPHYRRPHLMLAWTGKGRSIPKVVSRRGAVVHRSKLTEVPTGYILPDGREIEPQ